MRKSRSLRVSAERVRCVFQFNFKVVAAVIGTTLPADIANRIVSVVFNCRLDTEIGGASNRLIEEMSKVKPTLYATLRNVYQSETRERVAVIPINLNASSKQSQKSK